MRMGRGWIAKIVDEEGAHGLKNFRIEGCCGGIVEVDAHVSIPHNWGTAKLQNYDLPNVLDEALRQLRRDEMWTGMRTPNSRAASERTDFLVEHIVAMYESALRREERLRSLLASGKPAAPAQRRAHE